MSARGTKRKMIRSALPIVPAFSSSLLSYHSFPNMESSKPCGTSRLPNCWIQHTFHSCDSCNFRLDITAHSTISSHSPSSYETSTSYPKFTSYFLCSALLFTYRYVRTLFNGPMGRFCSLQLAAQSDPCQSQCSPSGRRTLQLSYGCSSTMRATLF